MRKIFLNSMVLLTLILFSGCSIGILEKRNEVISNNDVETVISNYLDALSNKDLEGIKKYSSNQWSSHLTNEFIPILEVTLESAKLIKYEIRENEPDKVLVDTEVEIICYENSSPSGDWIPGKSISTKSFELVKVDNEWKINGWGAY